MFTRAKARPIHKAARKPHACGKCQQSDVCTCEKFVRGPRAGYCKVCGHRAADHWIA